MTVSSGLFAPACEQDVTRLVLEYPFAWVVTPGNGGTSATAIPIRPVVDAEGRVAELRGHFARSNPHVEQLRRTPRSLFLFMGPHGYISSSWLRDRTRAPTWNYAAVQYVVDVELVEDEARLDALVRDLVDTMETGRPTPWSPDEMGDRYRRLASGIVGFHAHIRDRVAKFKLGQDERDSEFTDIEGALEHSEGSALLEWMRQANRSRTR